MPGEMDMNLVRDTLIEVAKCHRCESCKTSAEATLQYMTLHAATTTERDRAVIARALLKCHTNEGLNYSGDNSVPSDATYFRVYNGAELIASGDAQYQGAQDSIARTVARAEMPIVFWSAR